MKSKFSLFLATILLLSFGACTKSSNSAAPDTNPHITISSSTTDLTGISKAMFLNKNNLDSIVILNTSSTDSSLISNLSTTPPANTSVNFLFIYLTSKTSITTSTYTLGGSNVVNMVVGGQINGQRYAGASLSTISIDTLSFTRVTGTFSAAVVNTSTFVPATISGRFNANF